MSSTNWRPGKRVAAFGGGPGSISTALAFIKRGYDVRVFERQPECKAIGGAVLLSAPVLAILRSYGLDSESFGSYTVTYFKNKSGAERVKLPFNPEVEKRMGIKGWHYGVLRSSIFKKMLELVPEGTIYGDHEFTSYIEYKDSIELCFKNGYRETADILIGADCIRSNVSRQAFGEPHLFHTGIRLWLAWCDQIPDIPPNYGFISQDWQYQVSFFPMLHEGNPGFEWWVVEPSWDWAQPMPRFLDATDFQTQVYRWEIFNGPSMKKWSTGRVVCVDGYFLANALGGVDVRDQRAVSAGFEIYEEQRVDYVNHNVEFARVLGRMFHSVPRPFAYLRDMIFDYTPVLSNYLKGGYLQKAE
ncbi:FAD/NAD(P)-binding domain-containing protein [Aspergillus ellipticus CBS 707.79]|uniref:FAD/NAD(P)-binding domain-containing protein n=1 Tax=Aspergillus ellipticus CBS 707.79 TaxID=1448320 RepID=A0A319DB00_9EURO|nr:FAD/NAD(P)-binding domain-containing protein [Aspergillus ellipticus CBS 707.79]